MSAKAAFGGPGDLEAPGGPVARPGWLGRAWRDARGRDALLAAVVGSWLVPMFVAFGPGLMTVDTFDMLSQGLSGEFTNVHSPLLSVVLGASVRWLGTPWPVFAAQLLALSGGMALLVRRARSGAAALVLLATFLWTPSVWATAAALWKDVALASALLIVVVALDRGWSRVALALAILAGTFRLNALTATLPLLVPALQGISSIGRPLPRRVAAFALATMVAVAAPKGVEHLVGARDVWPPVWVLTYDLAAVYVKVPQDYRVSILAEQVSYADLTRIYDPSSSVPLFFGDPVPRLDMRRLVAQRSELVAEWKRELLHRPWVYVGTRLDRFGRFIGVHTYPVEGYPFADRIEPNPYGFRLHKRRLAHRAFSAVRAYSRGGLVFCGWLWMSLLVALAYLGLRKRSEGMLGLWTALSGLLYVSAYFVFGPAADFRYMFWTVVSVFASAALLLGREAEGTRT